MAMTTERLAAIKRDEVAQQIADLIASVDTDYRGNVLLKASEKLQRKSQNFTATVFNLAAHSYGIKT